MARGRAGHVPLRTCVGCRRRCPSVELRSLALQGDRVVVRGPRGRGGRGAWIHAAPACIDAALKTRAFARAFRAAAQVPDPLALYGAMSVELKTSARGE